MKRIGQWTAATAAAAAAGVIVLNALPSQAATQLTLNATLRTSAFVIPCGTCVLSSHPAHAHIGGTEYDAGRLTDQQGHGVGNYVIEETGMTPFVNGAGRIQLVGTLHLGGGQITFQGVEDPPLTGGVAAITGGTGRFRNATGEITYTDRSQTVTHLVIDVE